MCSRTSLQISVAASFEMLLAVPDKSPYRSLKDVVDAAQKDPGKINLGAINPGSTQNLSAHLFQQVTGAQYTVIPYRTTPDLVTALLRGDVDLGFDYYAALHGVIGPDKIRIIATSGERRNPLLKDVPTARESGFPDYIVTSLARRQRCRRRSSPFSMPPLTRLCPTRSSKQRRSASAWRQAAARRNRCMTGWRRTPPNGAR
jgi:Tripartite tricarboxylate transporter family receptor